MSKLPRPAITLAALLSIAAVACVPGTSPPSAAGPLDFSVEVNTVRSGFDRDTGVMWTQAYVGAVQDGPPTLLLTMSRNIVNAVDNYGDLYESRAAADGRQWTAPEVIAPLRRKRVSEEVEESLSDFVPAWHFNSGVLLGTGKLFVYDMTSTDEDQEAARRAAYSVYRPDRKQWAAWKNLEFPEQDHAGYPIVNPTAGCTQRYDLPDGGILLPIYYERDPDKEEINVSTVVRCSFDGETLRYLEHGSEHSIDRGRGLGEPSVAYHGGEYFLTLRSNHSAYVARSEDGLQYTDAVEWRFDDGEILGSYNTQQHWVSHSEGLFLVYTRRGARNDEIFRHRAPLFVARVDTERLRVIRSSERVLIPKRGARLGNFGVTDLSPEVTLISVAERMQDNSEELGADNSVYVARIQWNRPNRQFPAQP